MTRRRAAVLAAALVFAVASPARAAQPELTGSIRLASQTAWVTSGASFDLHVDVKTDQLAALDVAVDVRAAVASRSEFAGTIGGRLLRRSAKRVVKSLIDLPTDLTGARVVSLPMPRLDTATTSDTLPALKPGVYPVAVELRVHGGDTLDHFVTHLVRVPDNPIAAPLAVAWVQPVHHAPGVISAVGDASSPLTLDVTPADITGLDDSALQPLRRAINNGSQLLASTWVPIDPTALMSAGHGDDIALQRQVGDDALLDALGVRGDLRTWSADRPVSQSALARLRDLGVTRLVGPESSFVPLSASITGQLTLTRPFSVDAGDDDVLEGAAVDDGMTAHFRAKRDRVLAAHQLLADLAVLYFDTPGNQRGVVVRAPQSSTPSPSFLRTALGALPQASIFRPVTLNGLFDTVPVLSSRGVPVVRTVTPSRAAPLPRAALARAHDDLDELASLVGPTSNQAETGRRQLLAAESELLSASERDAALADASRQLDQLRGNLRMSDNRTIRLTAREGTIPLTIVNDNPFPVHAQLVLSSEKLEFTGVRGGDRSRQVLPDIVLQPGNNPRTVTVRARASAAFSLRATLLAPDGGELLRSRFTIVSTVFSGVGIVLSIVSALFLVIWWVRHWRTARRDRRLVRPTRSRVSP